LIGYPALNLKTELSVFKTAFEALLHEFKAIQHLFKAVFQTTLLLFKALPNFNKKKTHNCIIKIINFMYKNDFSKVG
jgi:hypothetical protein